MGKVEERFIILKSLGIVLWPQSLHIEKIQFLGQENSAASPAIAAAVDAEVML